MANFFYSQTNPEPRLGLFDETTTDMHEGTSTTAGDKIELRFDQTLTRFQVLLFLERAERWLKQGGANAAGANMGVP